MATSVSTPTPHRCDRLSLSVARWDDRSPDGYRDRAATSGRKPSSLGWTAESCTSVKAWHQLTTELVANYGHLVIEDLDVAAMKKSMGRRVSPVRL